MLNCDGNAMGWDGVSSKEDEGNGGDLGRPQMEEAVRKKKGTEVT